MIQMLTPFRADQYVAEGGAALGAGIGGGLANLGDALAKALEKKKQRNQAAKASAAFFKSSPDLQQHLGISPEDYEGLSADDKIDATTSGIASLKLHSELSQAKEQGKVRQAQLAEFLAKQNERQSMTDIAGQLSQQGQAPGSLPFDISSKEFARRTAPPDLMSAIARLGPGRGIEPRAAADLADSLARMRSMGGQALGPLSFEEDPATGARFARGGNTILPSGTNPEKLPKEGQEIFDVEGNLLGHNVPTGGGKFAFRPLKPSASGELLPVLDPVTRKPVPGLGMDATGKVHDYRNVMQKTGFGESAPEPAKGGGKAKFRFNPKTGQLEPNE